MTGVPESETTAHDFVMVRAALVQRLGGANNALVWTRIHFRIADGSQRYVDDDGIAWWRASNEQIGEEVGLTADQVYKATTAMRRAGFLESTEHRLGGNYDRTQSWRAVVDRDGVESVDRRNGARRSTIMTPSIDDQDTVDRRDVPSTEDMTSSSEVADATPRPDVLQIIEALEQAIEANGGKKPARTKKNLDAARLLLDRDEHTVDQVLRAIRWATNDPFWRANILSMSKLREKYDQLRLNAMRDHPQMSKQPAYAGRQEYTPPE
ncbi:hypothetical protein [Curtobacterium sp. MCBD17_003]|uniref:hypothetical protein n=1 Tax=Curtobacterium sp. MCBD17_003 TaxID=2175667 RepID=UPI000DA9E37C|nr:hypothetical protein [Curtobacterium sp. MCBD17_003]WIE54209.1 hypothetical protein DEI88_013955 [Curtobacterium sp. MCBD17_003]